MTIHALVLCALPMLAMAAAPCHAELTHPLYLQASDAYAHDQYARARDYFKQYKAADAGYLARHPSDNKAVVDAISFCDRKLAPSHQNQRTSESIAIVGKNPKVVREHLELSGKVKMAKGDKSKDGVGPAK